MDETTIKDPFETLGVAPDATEEEIRARYLELVKQYSPERDPEMFRKIQAAFDAIKDPLTVARKFLTAPSDECPAWEAAIEEQKQIPPPLSTEFVLSLGNRDATYRKPVKAK